MPYMHRSEFPGCTLRFKDSCVLEQRLGPQTLESSRDSLLEDEGTHEHGARTGETDALRGSVKRW